ncbi:hypothetical protein VHEMI00103 [[Torrubiella] hemipterigena]|uniref:Pseudouridine synthase I TruA alpha/beta domain-containing protein n=1 Tax=[Torrubiella] hemipterigena TaxID=1531966 RepID=A0A0A1T189_9HYPO|nr:hypothetical protein VHEMI00103 [[Torrubiella] hemipterigena]
MAAQANYNSWTKTGLIDRVKELEAELKNRPAPPPEPVPVEQPQDGGEPSDAQPKPKKPKGKRKMDPSKYSSRFIALKLAYLGKNYGGFEFQAMGNQPSIEEELWNALTKACLIFPEDDRVVQWDCCEYSKCGRTDRGVSAFGQVIGIRVRSNRPLPKEPIQDEQQPTADGEEEAEAKPEKPFDPIRDEIAYPRVLNRLLPPDIRILAWCPSPPPDFSARFSCRERQYRYFFTQPAFSPEASASTEGVKTGWLDIDAMRDAAKRYEGEQDFRNVCKIDPAKLITNWKRTIFESDIVEVKDVNSALPYLKAQGFAPESMKNDEGVYPKVYYFHVRGSAFLWHQIRHMVALLFLVGQGLEKPSLISEILDVEKNPAKPAYVMADEVPLVLWDCIFPDLSQAVESTSAGQSFEDIMQWVYVGDEGSAQGKLAQFGPHGLMDSMWQHWREKKMDELLSNRLLQHVAEQITAQDFSLVENKKLNANASVRAYEGGNTGRLVGKYVPVMKKAMMESPEVQNDRYARRKGFADAEDMRAQRNARGEEEDVTMEEKP